MIGIVVVSHSRPLARAAVALATEMVPRGEVPAIAVAAGLDEDTLGTDAAAVAEAIGTVDSPDGVLVFLDLGSAVLSAEMALEFLDPDAAARVRLTAAPLVEGLVAAVVTASTGASLDRVEAEARQGLLAKSEHLGHGEAPAAAATTQPVASEGRQVADIPIINAVGLHARPIAVLVKELSAFDAEVQFSNATTGAGPVRGDSVILIATLGVQRGQTLHAEATGPQAAAALAKVQELAAGLFGEAN